MINAIQPLLLDLLLAAVLLPLLVAAGFVVPRLRTSTLKLAAWSPLPALLLSLLMTPGQVLEIPWLLLGTRLGIDETGQVFLFFTALLWLLSGLYATSYLHDQSRSRQMLFYTFFLLSMSGNLGLIVALDMASFFFFYALMSFSAYGLVIHSRDQDALRAGRVYMTLVVVGEVLLFSTIAVFAASGETNLPYVGNAPPDYLVALVLLGFGIKAGALPLHVWLPLAHPAAPVPASAVLSGTMIKAGLLGWLRFLPLGTAALPDWGLVCVIGGFIAAFYGVAVGVTQHNPKTVLAYSSISQMGLMTVSLGLGLAFPQAWPFILPALLIYAMHHAFAKGALFLGVGVATHSSSRHLILLLSTLPALALAGFPFTSGAVAKTALTTAIQSGALPWSEGMLVLLTLAAIGTTILMARFLFLLPAAEPGQRHTASGLWITWLITMAIGLTLFWLWPVSLEFSLASLKAEKLFASIWPVALGVGVAWAVWHYAATHDWIRQFMIPAGDMLVVFSRLIPYWQKICASERWARMRQRLANGLRFSKWSSTAQEFLSGVSHYETLLRQWQVAGVVFLVLVVVVTLTVATWP